MRTLDLFTGIGGFALGLERAGAEAIAFCEIDDYAAQVLEKQWPNVPNIKGGVIALNALLRKARTASRQVFHARTSRLPGQAPDLPAPVRDSSGLYFEPFAWFDRDAHCWRTWQRCLIEGWEEFSGPWPRSGMTRSGIAYRRQPLVLLTSGTASGSFLPTPEASNTKAVALRSAGRSPRNFLAPLPTPTASEHKYRIGGNSQQSKSLGAMAARGIWPTPRAEDSQCSGGHRGKADTLYAAVVKAPGETPGSLNPTWVEWLMGFPLGWTDCGVSATRSSRKSSKRSAAR